MAGCERDWAEPTGAVGAGAAVLAALLVIALMPGSSAIALSDAGVAVRCVLSDPGRRADAGQERSPDADPPTDGELGGDELEDGGLSGASASAASVAAGRAGWIAAGAGGAGCGSAGCAGGDGLVVGRWFSDDRGWVCRRVDLPPPGVC